MATFIERYVRTPISAISAFEVEGDPKRLKLLDLEARLVSGNVIFKIGTHKRLIVRAEDKTLADDEPMLSDE